MTEPVANLDELPTDPYQIAWNVKTVIAYALATGADPSHGLEYLSEAYGPAVLPSFTSALSIRWVPTFHRAATGWGPLILATQRWEILGDIPVDGRAQVSWRLHGAVPAGRNTAITVAAELTGESGPIARALSTAMSRHQLPDGDVIGTRVAHDRFTVPDREPDAWIEAVTSPQLTAIYRLTLPLQAGQRPSDALHIDPEVARQAGLPAPPLHGPAVEGVLLRHALELTGGAVPARTMTTQFHRPIVAGDRFDLRVWRDGDQATVVAGTDTQVRAIARIGEPFPGGGDA